jgi:hypothetical protein
MILITIYAKTCSRPSFYNAREISLIGEIVDIGVGAIASKVGPINGGFLNVIVFDQMINTLLHAMLII